MEMELEKCLLAGQKQLLELLGFGEIYILHVPIGKEVGDQHATRAAQHLLTMDPELGARNKFNVCFPEPSSAGCMPLITNRLLGKGANLARAALVSPLQSMATPVVRMRTALLEAVSECRQECRDVLLIHTGIENSPGIVLEALHPEFVGCKIAPCSIVKIRPDKIDHELVIVPTSPTADKATQTAN
jgi:hypothetical protein